MDLGFEGRIALISGADSGMGKETARLLLEAGVRVARREHHRLAQCPQIAGRLPIGRLLPQRGKTLDLGLARNRQRLHHG